MLEVILERLLIWMKSYPVCCKNIKLCTQKVVDWTRMQFPQYNAMTLQNIKFAKEKIWYCAKGHITGYFGY